MNTKTHKELEQAPATFHRALVFFSSPVASHNTYWYASYSKQRTPLLYKSKVNRTNQKQVALKARILGYSEQIHKPSTIMKVGVSPPSSQTCHTTGGYMVLSLHASL